MLDKKCRDQIFAVLQAVEKCMNVQKKIYCTFLVLEIVYDKVNGLKLCNVLHEYGVADDSGSSPM